MADKSKIEWCDATWNPIVGCSSVSPGCANCYAVRSSYRVGELLKDQRYLELTTVQGNGRRGWNGKVNFFEDRLDQPIRWRKPRRIFVNSQSDLFHEDVPFETVDKILSTIAACPHHTFMVLTKRPDRMKQYMDRITDLLDRHKSPQEWPAELQAIFDLYIMTGDRGEPVDSHDGAVSVAWPLPNLWLGVSVENQECADKRIPILLQIPAAVRFLSCEPLLSEVMIFRYLCDECDQCKRSMPRHIGGCFDPSTGDDDCDGRRKVLPKIDWVIAGGESGPDARPCHYLWAELLQLQCQNAKVPFFWKQWGEWIPAEEHALDTEGVVYPCSSGVRVVGAGKGYGEECWRLGKKITGRLLRGREWNEFPEVPR